MQLVDTSAWIEVFRRPPAITLDDIVADRDSIVTCLPIIQEVLQGFNDERAFRIAETAMHALPCVESPLTARCLEPPSISTVARGGQDSQYVRASIA